MLGEVFDFAKESPAILEDSQQMAPRVSENDIAFFFPFMYVSEFTTQLCEFKSISSMLIPSVLMIDQQKNVNSEQTVMKLMMRWRWWCLYDFVRLVHKGGNTLYEIQYMTTNT